MNSNDLVPLLIFHVGECLVSEDTSIVDDDINAAESVDCSLHDCISVFG
jgi:hypothetical protein